MTKHSLRNGVPPSWPRPRSPSWRPVPRRGRRPAATARVDGAVVVGPGRIGGARLDDGAWCVGRPPPTGDRRSGEVLKVATSLYPPVTFYEEDGETLTGFDYEITEEIGSRLGVDIDWNVIDFANIMPGIESGQYDFATDLNDTAEREEVVDFVTEFRDGTSIMVPTGNPDSIAASRTCAAEPSSSPAGARRSTWPTPEHGAAPTAARDAIDLLEVPDDPDAMLAMRQRTGRRLSRQHPRRLVRRQQQRNADVELIDGVYDQVFAGFVLPKDSTVLRDAVLAAMQSLIDDGTYAEVMIVVRAREQHDRIERRECRRVHEAHAEPPLGTERRRTRPPSVAGGMRRPGGPRPVVARRHCRRATIASTSVRFRSTCSTR